jgi:2-C-methyl-D-erythritol 4-phosphate cytidylyltransferase
VCLQYNFTISHDIAKGGETRFDSVKNGLALIQSDGLVGVHDAVRPLVSLETIQKCFETAKQKGNAIPVIAINESIRKITDTGNQMVNRAEYVAVQTPQVFQTTSLKKAYLQEFSPAFTDDASVIESIGEKINLVPGNPENIKITLPSDLKIAELFLESNF